MTTVLLNYYSLKQTEEKVQSKVKLLGQLEVAIKSTVLKYKIIPADLN